VIHTKIDKQALLIRNAILKEENRKKEIQKQKELEIQKIREAREMKIREAHEKKIRKEKEKNDLKKEIHTKKKENLVRYVGGLNPASFRSLNSTNDSGIATSILIEWDDITFQDGFISVRYKGKLFEKFAVKNICKSLNTIKPHYKFRNAPKLSVVTNDYRILRIVNVEILFYYIEFLTNAGSLFSNHLIKSAPVFNKYKTYTKSYYKTHLPELFQTDCFSFLCELADNNLPIIPVPEVVINRNGIEQIDDSFLFPFVNRRNIYWLWETLELDFESQLQTIFDYLTGSTLTKRKTLIDSTTQKQQLCLKTRIMHTDFTNWKNEVKIYLLQ
jgi:hypothetical protein